MLMKMPDSVLFELSFCVILSEAKKPGAVLDAALFSVLQRVVPTTVED